MFKHKYDKEKPSGLGIVLDLFFLGSLVTKHQLLQLLFPPPGGATSHLCHFVNKHKVDVCLQVNVAMEGRWTRPASSSLREASTKTL